MLPLAMLVLLACKSKKEQPKQAAGNQPVVVDVIIASTSSLSNTLEVNGTVVANEAVELRPEISGRLVQLNLPEGASVKQGTVLAKINDADIAATLEKTKVQLDLAEKTEARLKKLLAVSGINQSDYDVALNQVNSLKADMAVTQALLDKAVVRAVLRCAGIADGKPGRICYFCNRAGNPATDRPGKNRFYLTRNVRVTDRKRPHGNSADQRE